MSPDERDRFAAVVDALDVAVAARPDLLASPAGFVLGALVGAGRSDADGTWGQVAGFADLLAYLVVYVREGRGDPADMVAAVIPAYPPGVS